MVDEAQANPPDFSRMNVVPLLTVALAFNTFSASSTTPHDGRGGWDGNGTKGTYEAPSGTALITFSGLWNGVNPYTNYTVVHRPMPSDYQPLMGAEPFTKPVDGADFDIQIGWDTAQCSNHGLNASVRDHTGDAVPAGKGSSGELGGGVMFALGPTTVTFSRAVEIPSLFWTFYESATQPVTSNGTISVFRNIDDAEPVKSVEVPYRDERGYVWRELTAFAGLKISKIRFDPRGQNTGLNIDDITIRISDGYKPPSGAWRPRRDSNPRRLP